MNDSNQQTILFTSVRAQHDLAFFGKLVLGNTFKPELIETLRAVGPQIDSENTNTINIADRQAGLTTCLALTILHELIFTQEPSIAVIMRNATQQVNLTHVIRELAVKAVKALNVSTVTVSGIMNLFNKRVSVYTDPNQMRGSSMTQTVLIDDAFFLPRLNQFLTFLAGHRGRIHLFTNVDSGNHGKFAGDFPLGFQATVFDKSTQQSKADVMADMVDLVFANFNHK